MSAQCAYIVWIFDFKVKFKNIRSYQTLSKLAYDILQNSLFRIGTSCVSIMDLEIKVGLTLIWLTYILKPIIPGGGAERPSYIETVFQNIMSQSLRWC